MVFASLENEAKSQLQKLPHHSTATVKRRLDFTNLGYSDFRKGVRVSSTPRNYRNFAGQLTGGLKINVIRTFNFN